MFRPEAEETIGKFLCRMITMVRTINYVSDNTEKNVSHEILKKINIFAFTGNGEKSQLLLLSRLTEYERIKGKIMSEGITTVKKFF